MIPPASPVAPNGVSSAHSDNISDRSSERLSSPTPELSSPPQPTSQNSPSRRRSTSADSTQRRLLGVDRPSPETFKTSEIIEALGPTAADFQKGIEEFGREMKTTTPEQLEHGVDAAIKAVIQASHEQGDSSLSSPPMQDGSHIEDMRKPSAPSVSTGLELVHVPLTNKQREIANRLEQNYSTFLRQDPESSDRAQTKALLEMRAQDLTSLGYDTPEKALKKVEGMLSRDRNVRMVLGGALMVGTGYTAGMWGSMRAVIPALAKTDLHPFVQGFIGGLIVSTADKVLSSGFAAVANTMAYGGGKTDLPALNAAKPSKKKAAYISGAVAGLGTLIKNASLRGAATQASIPNRYLLKLGDLAADTGGSFLSGSVGRQFSHKILLGKVEGMNLLAQADFKEKAQAHSASTAGKTLGEAILKYGTFAKASGDAFKKPSNYINAMWCGMLMGILQNTHAVLDKKYLDPNNQNDISREEAALHTLASSVLMGILVGGSVTIGILGLCDAYASKAREKFDSAFNKNPSPPSAT